MLGSVRRSRKTSLKRRMSGISGSSWQTLERKTMDGWMDRWDLWLSQHGMFHRERWETWIVRFTVSQAENCGDWLLWIKELRPIHCPRLAFSITSSSQLLILSTLDLYFLSLTSDRGSKAAANTHCTGSWQHLSVPQLVLINKESEIYTKQKHTEPCVQENTQLLKDAWTQAQANKTPSGITKNQNTANITKLYICGSNELSFEMRCWYQREGDRDGCLAATADWTDLNTVKTNKRTSVCLGFWNGQHGLLMLMGLAVE